MKPAFGPEGTITAGNASSINDGAAALLVASPTRSRELGLTPLAKIVGSATFSREPEWFTIAPVGALEKLLENVGWTVASTDLFEINEAFAAVTMAAEKSLEIPAEKVNIFGGAVALGHPIGAQRCPRPGHAAERPEADRQEAWHCLPLCRRWRGRRPGRRAIRVIAGTCSS